MVKHLWHTDIHCNYWKLHTHIKVVYIFLTKPNTSRYKTYRSFLMINLHITNTRRLWPWYRKIKDANHKMYIWHVSFMGKENSVRHSHMYTGMHKCIAQKQLLQRGYHRSLHRYIQTMRMLVDLGMPHVLCITMHCCSFPLFRYVNNSRTWLQNGCTFLHAWQNWRAHFWSQRVFVHSKRCSKERGIDKTPWHLTSIFI